MFVFSFKASSVRFLSILCACLLAGAFVIALMPDAGYAVNVNKIEAVENLEKINVSANKGRVKYINALGFEVDEENVVKNSEKVPEVFSAAFEQYNNLQKSQGFDLQKLKGKTVTSYTYKIKSYPEGFELNAADGVITLVCCKNKVVGADVCSASMGKVFAAVKPV